MDLGRQGSFNLVQAWKHLPLSVQILITSKKPSALELTRWEALNLANQTI